MDYNEDPDPGCRNCDALVKQIDAAKAKGGALLHELQAVKAKLALLEQFWQLILADEDYAACAQRRWHPEPCACLDCAICRLAEQLRAL